MKETELTVDQAKIKGLMFVMNATTLMAHQYTINMVTGKVWIAA